MGFWRRRHRVGAGAIAGALTATLLGTAGPLGATARAAEAAGPCYNVLKHEGDTTHIEVWYLCNSVTVASIRVWLTRPLGQLEYGHFELRHGSGLIANSGRPGTDWHWKVGQQYVWNGSFRSWNGDLVCTNFWISTGVNGNNTYRKFGGTNCITT